MTKLEKGSGNEAKGRLKLKYADRTAQDLVIVKGKGSEPGRLQKNFGRASGALRGEIGLL